MPLLFFPQDCEVFRAEYPHGCRCASKLNEAATGAERGMKISMEILLIFTTCRVLVGKQPNGNVQPFGKHTCSISEAEAAAQERCGQLQSRLQPWRRVKRGGSLHE